MGEALQELMQEDIDKKVIAGREEGRAEEKREQITAMLKKGKTPEQIAEFCGYPMELISEIETSLKAAVTVTVTTESVEEGNRAE